MELEEFLCHPMTRPLPEPDPCSVVACTRNQEGAGVYCRAHMSRWIAARKLDQDVVELVWRRTDSAIPQEGEVSLRGLAPLVIAQVLLGLQLRTRDGAKTSDGALRPVCDLLRQRQASTTDDFDERGLTKASQMLVRRLRFYLTSALLDPETERAKTIWDGRAFGRNGTITFDGLTQSWLQGACMRWAADSLPKRRGPRAVSHVRAHVQALELLSASLRAQRHDRGEIPAALGRTDIENFLHRMAFLQQRGDLTEFTRYQACRHVHTVLLRMRTLGLAKAGQPAAGLPDDFVVSRSDLPRQPDRKDAERDLPPDVMRQLCTTLPVIPLDGTTRQARVAIELLIDTGRRPEEICAIAWECLSTDPDGKPVLIYDNVKEHRFARRLPIGSATAELIADQQLLVRARYPDTPLSELKLLPRRNRNPQGSRAITESAVAGIHRKWVGAMPPLIIRVGDCSVEFDKSRIVLYAYRHCYAQRHADAGVPIDVLRELMDHEGLDSVHAYYRVSAGRQRQAIDRVSQMQFDRHGNRVWRQAVQILSSERMRQGFAQVAVPFGKCSEPSNVQAGGGSCPIRYRCAGCDHFNTDVSYLPDLEGYLADLLRNRERIIAMAEADAWAKAEATPSDEEVGRIRKLISQVKSDLDELSDEDRAAVRQACAAVRKTRQLGSSLVQIRQPIPDLRPERTP